MASREAATKTWFRSGVCDLHLYVIVMIIHTTDRHQYQYHHLHQHLVTTTTAVNNLSIAAIISNLLSVITTQLRWTFNSVLFFIVVSFFVRLVAQEGKKHYRRRWKEEEERKKSVISSQFKLGRRYIKVATNPKNVCSNFLATAQTPRERKRFITFSYTFIIFFICKTCWVNLDTPW